MVSVQNLEFELQNLFKEKKFSEIIFEITTKTQENERKPSKIAAAVQTTHK